MKKCNVLVIDDESINHYLCERALSAFEWIEEIDSAYNGKEAIQLLQVRCAKEVSLPDLIILDIDMPLMDGFQFIREFKTLTCHSNRSEEVVIAVVSSSIDPLHHSRARQLGVRHFIEKPITMEKMQLLAAMEFNSN